MLFHVFGHVDADDVLFVVKQRLRERLGKLRLTHAGRAEEQEGTDGPVRILYARARAQDGLGDLRHGLVLTDHALMEYALEPEQLFALALHQFGYGDARPAGDDARDLLFRHAVAQQRRLAALLLRAPLLRGELLFELRQAAVLQFGGAI